MHRLIGKWRRRSTRYLEPGGTSTSLFEIHQPHQHLTIPQLPSPVTAADNMATTVTTTDATTAIPPSQSLYLQNLPEKLQKHDLKRNLYMLFSTYGPVLDVTAVKTSKMRGQAHVLFRDANTATQAMRHTQGMDFFGRELVSFFLLLQSECETKKKLLLIENLESNLRQNSLSDPCETHRHIPRRTTNCKGCCYCKDISNGGTFFPACSPRRPACSSWRPACSSRRPASSSRWPASSTWLAPKGQRRSDAQTARTGSHKGWGGECAQSRCVDWAKEAER